MSTQRTTHANRSALAHVPPDTAARAKCDVATVSVYGSGRLRLEELPDQGDQVVALKGLREKAVRAGASRPFAIRRESCFRPNREYT